MMKINKKVLIGASVIICMILIGIYLNSISEKPESSEQSEHLELTIKTVKKVYEKSNTERELEIIATFKNRGSERIILAHPGRCLPDSWKESETYHVSELIGKSEIVALVVSPNNQQVSLRNFFDVFFVLKNETSSDHLVINPGESKEIILSKFGHEYAMPYWALYPDKPIREPLFSLEGPYQINIIYKNIFSRAAVSDKEGRGKIISVWTGTLTSNTIKIDVVEKRRKSNL